MNISVSHGPISQLAAECKAEFVRCMSTTGLNEQTWLRSAQGNFNLWCAGIKAIQPNSDRSSFDYRLRKEKWQSLREDICDLIRGLLEALNKCQHFCEESSDLDQDLANVEEDTLTELSYPDSPQSPVSWTVLSKESSGQISDLSQLEHDGLDPVLVEYASYVKTILNQLVRVTLAIRKSGNKYKFEDIDAQCNEGSFEAFRRYLVALILKPFEDEEAQIQARGFTVDQKLQQASDLNRLTPVQRRLVRANILRRNRIEYMTRKMRRESIIPEPAPLIKEIKPEKQLGTSKASTKGPERTSIPSTGRIATPSQGSSVQRSATEPGSKLDVDIITKKRTFSSATKMTKIGASQVYPQLPKQSLEGTLICPFCNEQLPSEMSEKRNEDSWKAHVAQDIVPYTCIIEDCDNPDEMYLTAESLLAHTLEKHSLFQWVCDHCTMSGSTVTNATHPNQHFASAEEWLEHVAKYHGDLTTEKERIVLAELSKRPMHLPLDCPLCPFAIESMSDKIDDHILLHLHEFSLLALPERAWETDEKSKTLSQGSDPLSYTHMLGTNATMLFGDREITDDDMNVALKSIWGHLNTEEGDQNPFNLSVSSFRPAAQDSGVEHWRTLAQKLLDIADAFASTDQEKLHCSKHASSSCAHLSIAQVGIRWSDVQDLIDELNYAAVDDFRGTVQGPSPEEHCPDNYPDLPVSANPSKDILDIVDMALLFPHEQPKRFMPLMQPESLKALKQPRMALVGPKDAGTSLIALHFIHRTLEEPGSCKIFWVDASSSEKINKSYMDIVESCDIATVPFLRGSSNTRKFLHHLTWTYSSTWLLVYSGLTRESALWLSLENLLPQGLQGSLLFTTADLTCLELLSPIKIHRVELSAWIGLDEHGELINIPRCKPRHRLPITSPKLTGTDLETWFDYEESLSDKIEEAFVLSDFHEPARYYLPQRRISELVTLEAIQVELDKFEADLQAKLQDNGKLYERFTQYDRKYRSGLAQWIHAFAPRLFAIVVLCDIGDFKLFLAMATFREHEFGDRKLPVLDPSELIKIFPPKRLWSKVKLRDFYSKQWQLLVPVFSPTSYDYQLDGDCILPFKLHKTMHKAGAYSSVYRIQIHQDHWLHDDIGDIALKELKVLLSNETQSDRETYGTNHAWEIEARALKVMNELDHPHVVKCIAAMRRGDSRYFMFPWAEGENLRDFWISSPRKEPSGEIILQAITQLLGIADALSHLHTYRGERRHSLPGNIAAPSIHVAPDDILGVPQIDGEETDEDDDLKMSNISIRHGNLKPENILRFGTNGDTRLGTLKIADMGLAKQHVLATSDRNAKRQITSTRYETQPYEAPEATTAMYGRSRLYDIWSMGCITLEFVIWILYGVERLTEFYNQIAGGSQLPYQYYEIPDAKEPTHAEVHRIVLTWMDHIETKDPECSQDSAIRDLLRLIREKLLVVRLPAISVSSRSALAPPALGEASSPFRATAEEVRNALKDILAKANHRPYLYTGKDRSRARPPENMLSPTAQRSDSGRIQFANSPLFSGVLGRPIRADYSLPPLQDWQFPVDNRFADAVALRVPDATFVPRLRKTPKLCERCEKLDFWTGGFFIDDDVSSLLISAQTCDFCRMLRDARRDDDMAATEQIRFERRDSNLLLEGNPFPALSIVRAPGARLTRHFQMGFPELPEPNTKPFYEILNLWLEDCNTNHNDTKIRNRDCRGVIKTRLPTRLIDVGTLEAPILRLVETQEEKLNKSQEYIALSHPWGDTRNYTPFCTLQKDAEGTRHEIDVFKQAIPYDELPATFRDAVICTRELKIQYLWIDSICIIQGKDGDFTEEAKYMEDVFSNAYCVLAASRASNQRDGFLEKRGKRNYITFHPENDQPFFICEPIDNFNKDVIQGSLNKRGWVLQERALARRTIYFTETQTYFECGGGVRCESLAKMHNNMADFLGDPRFPDKAMRNTSRALKIEYFQGLYKQYSRLDFTRYEDRPIAIAGLEKRLRNAFATHGGFGIFDDGDRSQLDNGLFHRSLLWKRSEEDVHEDEHRGQGAVSHWLEPIVFPPERDMHVPTWSWMAYKGAIDYMDPPYGTADWETTEITPPWTQGQKAPTDLVPLGRQVALQAVVRDFNVAGSRAGEVKLVYDRERTKGSNGQRAQCVVVAKSKERKAENSKSHFVLLVTETQFSTAGTKVYERAGVGVMLGLFIGLAGEGVKAWIV